MISSPFDSTHGERFWAWQDITTLGLHRRWDDIGRGMTLPPLDSTHGGQLRAWHDITAFGKHTRSATSGVASHHCPWLAHTVGRRQPWHAITTFGQHTRSNNVGNGMPSSPLGSTHDRTTSGVACHHSPWTATMVKRRQAWHAIIAFGQHKRSNDVGRGMPPYTLGGKHGQTTSSVA